MNEVHIHLHIADASTLNLRDLIAQANSAGASDAAPTPRAANVRTFYVAVYRSMRQRFALGHRLYVSAERAQRNASHGNFHSIASFSMNLDTHQVSGFNGPGEARYWAVLKNEDGVFSLGHNSYTDIDQLDEEYDDRFATLSGEAVDGRMSLAGV